MLSTSTRSNLLLAAVGGIGLYLGLHAGDDVAVTSEVAQAAPRATARSGAAHARARPQLVALDVEVDDSFDDELGHEEVRGHAPIEDPAELAFVFSLGSETYLRLSDVERASARGRERMIHDADVLAVVAGVEPHALPAHLRSWVGRDVVVDGACQARVVGFAEVSRVTGEPPGSWEYERDDPEAPSWTMSSVVEHGGVMLAARLDRCEGTWARATDYSPAAVAARIEAPALEAAARAQLLARTEHDAAQDQWLQSGGEGDWRDAVEVSSEVYLHPFTEEPWIFVRAVHDGSCGEPYVARMAAYRVTDGRPRPFAELDFAHSTIQHVVDLDGDGQPELVLGDSDHARVVDLANEHHTSIYVPSFPDHGCGC